MQIRLINNLNLTELEKEHGCWKIKYIRERFVDDLKVYSPEKSEWMSLDKALFVLKANINDSTSNVNIYLSLYAKNYKYTFRCSTQVTQSKEWTIEFIQGKYDPVVRFNNRIANRRDLEYTYEVVLKTLCCPCTMVCCEIDRSLDDIEVAEHDSDSCICIIM